MKLFITIPCDEKKDGRVFVIREFDERIIVSKYLDIIQDLIK